MAIELNKQEAKEVLSSLQKYFKEELEEEISEMRAKFLLDYFLKEIAPFAYNKGVKDAEMFFRGKIEDLSGTCFEDGLTYWLKKKRILRAKIGSLWVGQINILCTRSSRQPGGLPAP